LVSENGADGESQEGPRPKMLEDLIKAVASIVKMQLRISQRRHSGWLRLGGKDDVIRRFESPICLECLCKYNRFSYFFKVSQDSLVFI